MRWHFCAIVCLVVLLLHCTYIFGYVFDYDFASIYHPFEILAKTPMLGLTGKWHTTNEKYEPPCRFLVCLACWASGWQWELSAQKSGTDRHKCVSIEGRVVEWRGGYPGLGGDRLARWEVGRWRDLLYAGLSWWQGLGRFYTFCNSYPCRLPPSFVFLPQDSSLFAAKFWIQTLNWLVEISVSLLQSGPNVPVVSIGRCG